MDATSAAVQIRDDDGWDWELIADQVMAAIADRVYLAAANEAIEGLLLEDNVPRQARVLLRHLCRRELGREVCFHSTELHGLRLWYADIGPRVH